MKKKTVIIGSIGIIVFIVLVCLIREYRKNERIEIPAITAQFDHYPESQMRIRINNKISSEKVDVLREMLLPEQWKKARYSGNEELLFRIRLNEGYEIYVYSSYVKVYDEYASLFKYRQVYYKLSPEAMARIAEYMK